jgi:hypothetical protein
MCLFAVDPAVGRALALAAAILDQVHELAAAKVGAGLMYLVFLSSLASFMVAQVGVAGIPAAVQFAALDRAAPIEHHGQLDFVFRVEFLVAGVLWAEPIRNGSRFFRHRAWPERSPE